MAPGLVCFYQRKSELLSVYPTGRNRPSGQVSYTVMLDSQLEWVTNTSIWTWSQAIEQSMPTFSLD